ncbi:MAG: EVE domain-containing protein [Fimbriimonadaceae bacterium]
MKSEPDVYSIDDLARETAPALWEGCRNYTVRNFMRDAMSSGDLALFYHSNADPPGVVGVMEIVGEAFADPTQFDGQSEYYDPKSPPEAPRWLARNVKFVRKFKRTISLGELRSTPSTSSMLVARKGQRLSVMPVTDEEWRAVLALPGL